MDDLPAAKLAFLQQNGQLKGYLAAKLAFLQQNGQLKGYLAAKLAFLQQNGQMKGYLAAKLAFLRLKELPKVILAAKKRFLQQIYTLSRLFCQSREQRPASEGHEMKIDVHDPPEIGYS